MGELKKSRDESNSNFSFAIAEKILMFHGRYVPLGNCYGQFYNPQIQQNITYYGRVPANIQKAKYPLNLYYDNEWHGTSTADSHANGLRNYLCQQIKNLKFQKEIDGYYYKTAAEVDEYRWWWWNENQSNLIYPVEDPWAFCEIPITVPINVKNKRIFLERLMYVNLFIESNMFEKIRRKYKERMSYENRINRVDILRRQVKQMMDKTNLKHRAVTVKLMQEVNDDILIWRYACSLRLNDVVTTLDEQLVKEIKNYLATYFEDENEYVIINSLVNKLNILCSPFCYQDDVYKGAKVAWNSNMVKMLKWAIKRERGSYVKKQKNKIMKTEYPDCAISHWVWRIAFQEMQLADHCPIRRKKEEKTHKELDKYNDFDYITEGDFVVKSYLFNCVFQGHKMEDVKALVNIQITGSRDVIEYKARGGYCYNCRQYFILQSEYETIRRIGIPLCEIVEYEEWVGNGGGNYGAEESVLKKYGYNVQAGNGMTDDERRDILVDLVEKGILSRGEIAGYLTFFINNKAGVEKYRNAVEKWMADRDFILKYDEEEMREVRMRKVEYRKIRRKWGD